MSMWLRCRLSGCFHPYRVNCLEIKTLFVHSPPILGDQMGQIHLCIKVVESEVFGPIFIARNDYIKVVILQICWMHLFVLVVYQIILYPIGMNGI